MEEIKDPVQEFINRVHNSGQGAPKNAERSSAMKMDDSSDVEVKKENVSLKTGDHVVPTKGALKGLKGTISGIGSKFSDGTTSCDFVIDKESWDGKGTRGPFAMVLERLKKI